MTARNPASSNRLACLLFAALAMLGCAHPTQADDPRGGDTQPQPSLTIQALPNSIPANQPVLVGAHGPPSESIDIALGDPVGLRVVLKNESEVATKPIPTSLNPLWMPAVVVVVHPDGHSTLSSTRDPRQIRVPPTIRSMNAGERLETDVFAYTDYASEISSYSGEPLEYLFPQPGQYDVYVVYFTRLPLQSGGESERWIDRVLDRIHRRDGVLHSNTVRVNVGPAFPGWEELRDAGLIHAVRHGYWISEHFSDEASRSIIDALVEQSGRDWLKEWYGQVKKSPSLLPAVKDDPPLSLTIRAMATELVVGEPIVLEVTLTNTGEQDLNVAGSLAKISNNVTYRISSDNAQFGQFRRLVRSTPIPNELTVVLAPGEKLRHIQWLHSDTGIRTSVDQMLPLVTKSSGVHTLHMQYVTPSNQEGEFWWITSNGVEVMVTELEKEWQSLVPILASLPLLFSVDNGMPRMGASRFDIGLLHEDEFSEKRDNKLEQLAASESPYAPYASMLQGGYELAGFQRLDTFEATIAGEEARALRALQYLEPADKDGFPLRSEAVWHIREAAILLGDDEAVERLTKRLETEFEGTHAAKRPSEIMKYKRGLR